MATIEQQVKDLKKEKDAARRLPISLLDWIRSGWKMLLVRRHCARLDGVYVHNLPAARSLAVPWC